MPRSWCNLSHIIVVDGFACVERGCACAWTFFGKSGTRISAQRHTRTACAGSNCAAEHMNCRSARTCMRRPWLAQCSLHLTEISAPGRNEFCAAMFGPPTVLTRQLLLRPLPGLKKSFPNVNFTHTHDWMPVSRGNFAIRRRQLIGIQQIFLKQQSLHFLLFTEKKRGNPIGSLTRIYPTEEAHNTNNSNRLKNPMGLEKK